MVTGAVNPFREAIVRLYVRGPSGQEQEVEALVDTGFTGALTLPPDLIAALGLPFRRSGRGLLADGTQSLFAVFEATVIWDGQPRTVAVDRIPSDPLLG